MRNDYLTIFTRIDIRNILTLLAILRDILHDIANSSHRLERLNNCFSHTSIPIGTMTKKFTLPQITNLPPIERRIEQNGVVVHTVFRGETALSGARTISKFHAEEVRKLYLTIDRFSTTIFSDDETGVFTNTIKKTTNRKIRFFLRFLVFRGLKSECTEKTLLRLQFHSLKQMIGARVPLLLSLFQTLITMTAGNRDFVIRLEREAPNRAMTLLSKFLVMRVDNSKRLFTHNLIQREPKPHKQVAPEFQRLEEHPRKFADTVQFLNEKRRKRFETVKNRLRRELIKPIHHN